MIPQMLFYFYRDDIDDYHIKTWKGSILGLAVG